MFLSFSLRNFSSKFSLFITCILVVSSSFGQSLVQYPELSQKFSSYEILHLDSKSIYNEIKTSNSLNEFKISLGNGAEWNLNLRSSGIIHPDYKVVSYEGGLKNLTIGTTAIPMKGTVNGISNSEVALTFNDNFVYGFIRIGFDEYYIEPVEHLIEKSTYNDFVVYSPRDIINSHIYECAYEVDAKELKKVKNNSEEITGNRMPGECIEIRYAAASDWSMRVKYGSNTGVENHNIGVMNDVQTNYDNEFADEIQFNIVEQWISACSSCDPWTTSTDAGALLDSFTDWAPSGFSSSHDLGGLWTNRNLDGGTVGIAWLGVLCTNLKYHVLQDFTSNATSLRVMTAHEIGHNFNASHDASGSGFIMAPSVNSSTTWSSSSINSMQNEYGSANCLNNCSTGSSFPTANFTYDVFSFCNPGQVQYQDLSTNATSWSWSFPGGTPSSSTQPNPLVQYFAAGTYDASLTVTNSSGSDNLNFTNVLTVLDYPFADFTTEVDLNTVICTFTGFDAQSYFWNFGDGQVSFDDNPTHTYLNDGTYTITCEVTNDCGTESTTRQVTIINVPTSNFSSNVQSGCQPLTVQFSNTSSANSTSFLWTFPGGNPATSTEQNPTVTYTESGDFAVTLVATNVNGTDTEVKTNYINVAPLAVPGFTVTQAGAQVTLNNISQYALTSVWSFGDGATSSELNPIHTYADNGVYTITLIASNDCGEVSITQTVTVALAPIAAFNTSTSSLCAGNAVTYASTSTYSPASYSWTFEGGSPASSSEANPVVTYNTPGTYDVSLTVTNANGADTESMTDAIIVNPQPTSAFSQIGDGLSVSFTSTATNAASVSWDFGDGQTSTELNPTHTYALEGSFTVILTAENSCGTVASSQTVLVQLLPTAGFSSDVNQVCSSNSIQFTSQSSSSVTSWAWTFEGGTPATSMMQNPLVTYNTPGTYDVMLVVTNASGNGSFMQMNAITVIGVPTSGFTNTIADNIVSLSNTGLGAITTTWDISGPTGMVQLTGNMVDFTADQNGEYIIVQTNTNECGQTVSSSQAVTINAFPVTNFNANGGLPICAGSEVVFNNLSVNGSTFVWKFEGGSPSTSTERSPIVVYNTPGTYTVELIASNALGDATLQTTITIGSGPTSGFDETVNGANVQFTYTGSTASSVRWEFGDGAESMVLDPSHTYTATGDYTVLQISTNECGQDTTKKVVSIIISSIADIAFEQNISISPNPNSGQFNILIQSKGSEEYNITLMDLLGRVVLVQKVKTNSTLYIHEIDGSNLPAANYILGITNGAAKAYKHVVIQK